MQAIVAKRPVWHPTYSEVFQMPPCQLDSSQSHLRSTFETPGGTSIYIAAMSREQLIFAADARFDT
jgi:hypothetical protein